MGPHTPQVLEPLLLRVMEAVHEGREFPMLMSLHLSILSRLILASHSLFAALCLTSASPVVLQRVYIVFLNIVETLNDVTKTDDVGATVDSLMAGVGDVVLDTDDIDYETEHDSRKRQIAMQDPVHTIVLKEYVQ